MSKPTVVLTNLFIKNVTGSELATLDYAKYFTARGWRVIICCFQYGQPLSGEIPSNIKIINILEQPVPKVNADLLWGHHWAIMTKLLADKNFSAKKIVYISLSPYEVAERLPAYAGLLSKRLANSWETKMVRRQSGIQVFNNSVTPDFLAANAAPGARLRKLAVVSNHDILFKDAEFKKILKSHGVATTFFGGHAGMKSITPADLLKFDAVVSIGRTVQYALVLGIPIFCYDRFGGPGYITLDNWRANEKMNYSGRAQPASSGNVNKLLIKKPDAKLIAHQLINDYGAARMYAPELQKIARKRYDLFRNMDKVLAGKLPDARISSQIINDKYSGEIANIDEIIQKYNMVYKPAKLQNHMRI
ncbi:MAG: hypothetical protein FWF34_01810, partial [Alphaproteobacteria bacterium]|nr:hypothetical protein [Alphaproteobacteria bacterium]